MQVVPIELLQRLADEGKRQYEADQAAKRKLPHSQPRPGGGASAVDRARRYLAKVSPSVSGQNGHDAAYHAACVAVLHFDLTPEQAWDAMQDWNAACSPPWSEPELRRKIDQANAAPGDRGGLLREQLPPRAEPPRKEPPKGSPPAADPDPPKRKPRLRSPFTSPEGYQKSDYGNAERLRDRHGKELMYCHAWKKWLCWDGKRWKVDQRGAVQQFAKATVRSMYAEAGSIEQAESRTEYLDFCLQSEGAARLNAIDVLARGELPCDPKELDQQPWLLNCSNGTLNLRTGLLMEHRQADRITKLAPAAYDPDASTYEWDKFLEAIFEGNAELIAFMRRWLGYCLTGDVREQLLPIFWGDGSNGKSTLLTLCMEILGESYAQKAPQELLTIKAGGESHPTALASLFGMRFVPIVETKDGARLDEVLVKELTGGDPITARRMKEDFWTFLPSHKVMMCTNHQPVIRGTDHGIWRRIALVPFRCKFWNPDKGETGPDELRADKGLPDRLRAEAPGILAWMVDGCMEWQRDGLKIPDSVRAATSEYRGEQDLLGQFIVECCITTASAKSRASLIYSEYRDWCEQSGEHPVSQRRFGKALSEKGFAKYRNDGWVYCGIGVKAWRGSDGFTEPRNNTDPGSLFN